MNKLLVTIAVLSLLLLAGSPIEPGDEPTVTVTPDLDFPAPTPPYTAVEVVEFRARPQALPIGGIMAMALVIGGAMAARKRR
jgi:hypothetical protein